MGRVYLKNSIVAVGWGVCGRKGGGGGRSVGCSVILRLNFFLRLMPINYLRISSIEAERNYL